MGLLTISIVSVQYSSNGNLSMDLVPYLSVCVLTISWVYTALGVNLSMYGPAVR